MALRTFTVQEWDGRTPQRTADAERATQAIAPVWAWLEHRRAMGFLSRLLYPRPSVDVLLRQHINELPQGVIR